MIFYKIICTKIIKIDSILADHTHTYIIRQSV